jgi:hypothetical protein
MLRHVVCFRWADGTTDEEVARVCEMHAALPGAVPELRRYDFGPDAGLAEGNFHFAIVADFDDQDGWLAYQRHPDHQAVVVLLQSVAPDRVRVQFDVDD